MGSGQEPPGRPGGVILPLPRPAGPGPRARGPPGAAPGRHRRHPRREGSCARRPHRSGGGAAGAGASPPRAHPRPGLSAIARRPGPRCTPLPRPGRSSALTSRGGFPPGGLRHPPGRPGSAPREVRDAQPLRAPAPPPLPGRVSSACPRARASHAPRPAPRPPAAAPGTARRVRENLTQRCQPRWKFPECDLGLLRGGGLTGHADHPRPEGRTSAAHPGSEGDAKPLRDALSPPPTPPPPTPPFV